jgi:peptide chain release factor 1
VRITHLPTGLSAECREHRQQGQNKRAALQKLAERIKLYWRERLAVERERNSPVVRTYHEPDNRVVDHRTGARGTYSDVLDGRGLDRVRDDGMH